MIDSNKKDFWSGWRLALALIALYMTYEILPVLWSGAE